MQQYFDIIVHIIIKALETDITSPYKLTFEVRTHIAMFRQTLTHSFILTRVIAVNVNEPTVGSLLTDEKKSENERNKTGINSKSSYHDCLKEK